MGMSVDEMLNIFLEETGEKRENITEYTRLVSVFFRFLTKLYILRDVLLDIIVKVIRV